MAGYRRGRRLGGRDPYPMRLALAVGVLLLVLAATAIWAVLDGEDRPRLADAARTAAEIAAERTATEPEDGDEPAADEGVVRDVVSDAPPDLALDPAGAAADSRPVEDLEAVAGAQVAADPDVPARTDVPAPPRRADPSGRQPVDPSARQAAVTPQRAAPPPAARNTPPSAARREPPAQRREATARQPAEASRSTEEGARRTLDTESAITAAMVADALHVEGVHRLEQGDIAEAVDRLGRAVEKAPEHPVYRNNYGWALHRAGDDAAAAEQLQRSIVLGPARAIPHANLAEVHLARGDTGAALASYLRFLELNEDPDLERDANRRIAAIRRR